VYFASVDFRTELDGFGGLIHRAMPEGEGDGCEYEVQWGLRVGAWKNVPPTAATVEDDGWGKKVWTMRVTEHVYPQAWYFVRVRATNQHGPGDWSPQSLKLCCEGGRSIAQAKKDGVEFDESTTDFLSDLGALSGAGDEEGVPPELEKAKVMTSSAKSTDAGLVGALAQKLEDVGSTAVAVSQPRTTPRLACLVKSLAFVADC
jgi:hypothetical protein